MASTLPPRPNLAAVLLREQLRERYPTLAIDSENTLFGTPVWEIVEDQVMARPTGQGVPL